MAMVRRLLVLCLSLGLLVNGLAAAHALPCGAGHHGPTPHREMQASVPLQHHHDHLHGMDAAPAHQDAAKASVPDEGQAHGGAKSCNCDCINLSSVADAALTRIEAPQRRASGVSYAMVAQAAPDGLQFIDPGIPIGRA